MTNFAELWYSTKVPSAQSIMKIERQLKLKPLFTPVHQAKRVQKSELFLDGLPEPLSIETTNFKTSWDPTDASASLKRSQHGSRKRPKEENDDNVPIVEEFNKQSINRNSICDGVTSSVK